MKGISMFLAIVLLGSLMTQSEAVLPVAWFANIARMAGVALVKNSWYARCNTRNLPSGVSCPSVIYGVGLSKRGAIDNARAYGRWRGSSPLCGDGRYTGHCQANKFTGGRRG